MGPLWRIVFVAAIVAIACASPARAESYLGLTFPEQIGGANLGEIHDYEKEQPGYGYSAAYDRPGWAIDVYIYDLGMSDIPDDPLSEVVLRQLVQAKGEILEVGRQGYYTDIKVKDEFVLKDGHGKPRYVCMSFGYFVAKRDADSVLCLTSWKHKFLKFRMTTAHREGSDREAENFVGAWAVMLWPSQ